MSQATKQEGETVSKTRLRLWLKLLKLTTGVQGDLRRRLRDEHGSTLPRFDVLAALARTSGGLKMSELSSYLRVSNGNVTGIVDRLTEDGLVIRIQVPDDRRAQIARLTPKGREEFAVLAAEHEKWIDELLGGLEEDDAIALGDLLDRAASSSEKTSQ